MSKRELAFGKVVTPHEPRVKVVKETVEVNQKFAWELEENATPYYLQGKKNKQNKLVYISITVITYKLS